MGADDTTGAACENNNHNVIEETNENGVQGEIKVLFLVNNYIIVYFKWNKMSLLLILISDD